AVSQASRRASLIPVCAVPSRHPHFFYNATVAPLHDTLSLHDALPISFGLVRYGVAPDHQNIKRAALAFERTAEHPGFRYFGNVRSEEHTSELQSRENLVCRLLLEKKKSNTRLSETDDDTELPAIRGA